MKMAPDPWRFVLAGIVILALACPVLTQPGGGSKPGDDKGGSNQGGDAGPTPTGPAAKVEDSTVGGAKSHTAKLKAGVKYTIRLKALQPGYDPYLYLYNPDGQLVAQDDDGDGFPNSKIVYTPTVEGAFVLKCSSFAGQSSGTYQLSIEGGSVILGAAKSLPGPQAPGVVNVGALDERPAVYSATKLPPGLPAWFAQLDTDKDGQIGLYEWLAAKKPLAEFEAMDRNGDGFLTPDELLYFLYGESDPDAVAIVSDKTGDKTAKSKFDGFKGFPAKDGSMMPPHKGGLMDKMNPKGVGAGPTPTGAVAKFEGSTVGGDKSHTARLKAGVQYKIRLKTLQSGYDPYLYLYNPDGQLVAKDDDGDGFPNSKIVYTPEVDGLFILKCSSFGRSTSGKYQLSIEGGGVILGSAKSLPGAQTPGVTDVGALDERPVVYSATNLPPGLPAWFAQLDTDKDGQIGLYEWLAAKKPLAEFEAMDRNGDGFLTPEEVFYFIYGETDPDAVAVVPDNTGDKTGKGKFGGTKGHQ